jgi:hypothetical protein
MIEQKMEEDEPEAFHIQMAHYDHHPFQDLHLEDESYIVHVQQNVPLRDGTYVIHQTGNVEFLVKQLQFVEQINVFQTDLQFNMRGKFKANDDTEDDKMAEDYFGLADPRKFNTYPLMEDCLQGIQQSVLKALLKLKDLDLEKRPRCYLTLSHRKIDTGIEIGIFFLESEDLPRVADILTTRLRNFINSGEYLHLDLLLDDSFQVRFLVSTVTVQSVVISHNQPLTIADGRSRQNKYEKEEQRRISCRKLWAVQGLCDWW